MDLVDEFGRFAELMPEGTLLVSVDGHVLAANRRIVSLLQAGSAAGLVGRRLADMVEAGDDAIRWLGQCARTRDLLPGALDFRRDDGERIACRAQGSVFRPASDTAPALVRLTNRRYALDPFIALNLRIQELATEVRRRRRAEQALRAEREWLRVTLEGIGDAVIATDEHGRVIFQNPVAETLTGWAGEEALGRPLSDVFVIVNEHTGAPVESPVDRVLREAVVVGLAMPRKPDLAVTRLVAVSGYGRSVDCELAAEAGFHEHLTKPVDPERVARLLME